MRKIKQIAGGVAVVIAVGLGASAISGVSPAQAAEQITGLNIKDNSVAKVDVGSQAVGTSELQDQSVQSGDISEGGVGASEVRNGSLTGTDMNPNTVQRFLEKGMTPSEKDTYATKADEAARAAATAPVAGQGTATVANIGGTFGKFPDNVRATILDTVDLPAGKYVVTGEGFFINNQATSGQTRMQLALRVENGTDWGQDLGTCFTGAVSPLANRESHCSSTRVVTLGEDSIVKVFAFGYADDQGSADSGKVNATSFVTAIPVQ